MHIQQGEASLSISGNGATITRWQVGEEHLFYQQQMARNLSGQLVKRGGLFIGAPVFGLPEKAKEYGFAQHGCVRMAEPLASIPDWGRGARYIFRFDPPSPYPYRWGLDVKIAIAGSSLAYDMEASRIPSNNDPQEKGSLSPSGADMPFNIGLHPYFPAPGAVRIGSKRITCEDMMPSLLVKVPRTGEVFIETGSKVIHMLTEGYAWLNLWTDHPGKYFCVEPLWDDYAAWGTERGKVLGPRKRLKLRCIFGLWVPDA